MSSVQQLLDVNIVAPYNTAVASTNYSKHIQVLLEYPDDLLLISTVPAIVLEDPSDVGPVRSTGNAEIMMCVYPGLYVDPTTGSQTASVQSAYLLRSLFKSLTTQLTAPLTDFSLITPAIVDYAYIDMKIVDIKGRMPILALTKRRFDVQLELTYAIPTQNGY